MKINPNLCFLTVKFYCCFFFFQDTTRISGLLKAGAHSYTPNTHFLTTCITKKQNFLLCFPPFVHFREFWLLLLQQSAEWTQPGQRLVHGEHWTLQVHVPLSGFALTRLVICLQGNFLEKELRGWVKCFTHFPSRPALFSASLRANPSFFFFFVLIRLLQY